MAETDGIATALGQLTDEEGASGVADQCYAQSWLGREIGDAWSAVGAGRGMRPVRRTNVPD